LTELTTSLPAAWMPLGPLNFIKKYLNMDLVLAISEDKVPSTGEPDPYIHIFLDAGNDNVPRLF
jgi:hypothetical protein